MLELAHAIPQNKSGSKPSIRHPSRCPAALFIFVLTRVEIQSSSFLFRHPYDRRGGERGRKGEPNGNKNYSGILSTLPPIDPSRFSNFYLRRARVAALIIATNTSTNRNVAALPVSPELFRVTGNEHAQSDEADTFSPPRLNTNTTSARVYFQDGPYRFSVARTNL